MTRRRGRSSPLPLLGCSARPAFCVCAHIHRKEIYGFGSPEKRVKLQGKEKAEEQESWLKGRNK
jgi:hypothetical protein